MFMDDCHRFVELPNVPYWKMGTPVSQLVLDGARHVVYRERARRYLEQSGDADVLHFQQTLNAFGSMPVFKWLAMPSSAARVVTIHELDPYQLAHPDVSASYNKADGVIVHTEEMSDELTRLGVAADGSTSCRTGSSCSLCWTGSGMGSCTGSGTSSTRPRAS